MNLEFLFLLLGIIGAAVILFLFSVIKNRHSPVFNYNARMKEVVGNKKSSIPRYTDGVLIGHCYKKPVYIEDNAKHIFVCGTTGSGKTVALANYIKRAFDMDYPALIVDGKGDINEDSILDITKKLGTDRKVYIINLSEPEKSDKYNPFRNTTPTVCKDMLINLTNWSEEHYKLNTERYLQRVITLMVKNDIELSFKSIIKHMPADAFAELSKELVKKEIISKEEHLENIEISNTSGKISADAIARFSLLAESELGTIFADDGIDITTAMQERAIILFVLNPLIYPETTAVMGRLILIDSKKAVSNLFNQKERSFFMFDEINTYASTVLIDLVNKSRSANVTCILATQSLSDLDIAVNESFKEQVIENCNNYIILRQNSFKSAEECAMLVGTTEKMQMTYQMSQSDATGMGTAKKVREFLIHPDEIKAFPTGAGVFLSRDNGKCERIKIVKPF